MTWKNRIQSDRNAARKADLATMGVSTQAATGIPFGSFSILLSHTPEVYQQASHADFNLLRRRDKNAHHRYRPSRCVDYHAQLHDFRLGAFGRPCPQVSGTIRMVS